VISQDSDLLKNVILFSQALRRRKVGVTIDNILDALRGVSLIELHKKEDFHHLLRANFVSHKEEMDIFDELFEQFWSFGDPSGPVTKKVIDEEAGAPEEKEQGSSFESKKDQPLIKTWVDERKADELKEGEDLPVYSPDEILQQKDFTHFRAEELEKVKDWVSLLSRKMAAHLSRRWKKGGKGDRLDFRRSIRQSIKYGGDIMELKMKERKPKPLRLILVCDVSGSMDIYSEFFLRFMHRLQNYYPHCETFAFSTRLSHITSLLKRRTFEQTLRLLSGKVLDWSGGTNIGLSLHQLHQNHSHLLNLNRTLFLIFSDGWDRGNTVLLESEMKYIKKQVKKIIWLNPLLGNQNYQPLCKGISAALPYIDDFLPYHNFMNLRNLGYLLLKM
jgi:uncharacterized protein with von Willebrand factor type A (vWA) domain